ncbi:MAG: hypothetical protein Q8R88_07305 [Desulfoprunum sp.]|nr:hypothetical protein [Desulfoprunum sp.]
MRYIVVIFLFLQGCAAGNHPLGPTVLAPTADSSPAFYTLTLKDTAKVRFNGLLGISAGKDGLHYILLDATGITLIEARIDIQGNVSQQRILGPLQKSGLPGYLAGALRRIFLEQPAPLPCEDHFLLTFCEERQPAGSGRKWLRTWPFTWWSLQYSDEAKNSREQSLVYRQFMTGITLYLRKSSS